MTDLGKLRGRRIVVVGDLMLDRYVDGEVSRINQEAPVPVLEVSTDPRMLAGGAANVACRLRDLGVDDVAIVGAVRGDAYGERLLGIIDDAGIDVMGVVVVGDRPTTTKTRYLSRGQQLLRVDREVKLPLTEDDSKRMAESFEAVVRRESCGAVVVSDYDKGVVNGPVLDVVNRATVEAPVIVDPRGVDWGKYGSVWLIKPNARELGAAAGLYVNDVEDAKKACLTMRSKCRARFICVTLGKLGIAVCESSTGSFYHYPAIEVEVFDVTGAGDAVCATLAAGFSAGLDMSDSVRLANMAASQVVQHRGVGTIDIERLQAGM